MSFDHASSSLGRVVALSGGIGGAKLALGLRNVLEPNRLAIIANTGDDFEHLGLHISPDIDTLLYTLSGMSDPERGWGRANETWNFMAAMAELGGETWFRLGDRDLAMHIERTRKLRAGDSLTAVTAETAARLNLGCEVFPMTDTPVRTFVTTDEGRLAFQDYFVRRQCRPAVTDISFEGIEEAIVGERLAEVLRGEVDAIVVCPSNPFISIEPILAVPRMRELLRATGAPIVAVSPIIGRDSVKGPTAKMFREMGLESTSSEVAKRYSGFVDLMIFDASDAMERPKDMPVITSHTFMASLEDREQLARVVLNAARASKDRMAYD